MDEDLEDLAVAEHVLEDAVGLVGVDVNLEVGVRAHDELAVAERREIREGVVRIEGLVGMEEELVAVAILRALPVVVELDGDLGGGCRLRVGGVDRGLELRELALALDGVDEALEEGGEPVRAGVDDAVLLEHGEKLGRARDRLIGLDHERVEHLGGAHPRALELIGL